MTFKFLLNTSKLSSISRKRLIFRLSSLGDVVLALSALDGASGVCDTDSSVLAVDWVVSREFSDFLKNDPRVATVHEFNRKEGIGSWIALCRRLWLSGYDEVFDLHGSLRTRLAKLLFRIWGLTDTFRWLLGRSRSRRPWPCWRTVSKQRWRLYGYFLFKKFWPKLLRPAPFVERFSRLVGRNGGGRPIVFINKAGKGSHSALDISRDLPSSYVCVMPGAFWITKCWPARNYFEVLRRLRIFPVVLGMERDIESKILVQLLVELGTPHLSLIGKLSLLEVAAVLKGARAYFGNDTGMAHVAEAVGVPAFVVFGPTVPDMGFGPWRKESRSIGLPLWCRPCGKDGRTCFRVWGRSKCLRDLEPESVSKIIIESLEGKQRGAD